MDVYMIPILWAIFIFPFIALIITLPYVLFEYHRYGSIPFLRTSIIYSFVLYLLTIYLLVILPLPSQESVAVLTTPIVQLTPFQSMIDLVHNTSFVWNQPYTYLPALKESYFYVIVFNILMFLPLGIYLHYYFRLSFWKTSAIGFLISLFFELTQLTGLYGIYPRPYRLFDVDDLIMNTLGVMLGYLMSPLVGRILPSKSRIDEVAYLRSKTVSFPRRILALIVDWFILTILFLTFHFLFPTIDTLLKYFLIIVVYYMIIPFFKNGKTMGKMIVHIQIISVDGRRAHFFQYVLRYGILYFVWLPAPFWMIRIINSFLRISPLYVIFICSILLLFSVILWVQLFLTLITRKNSILYEKWSRTKTISTLKKESIKVLN